MKQRAIERQSTYSPTIHITIRILTIKNQKLRSSFGFRGKDF